MVAYAIVACIPGCGLILDFGDDFDGGGNGRDAGPRADVQRLDADGARDASSDDGGPDANVTDADALVDATAPCLEPCGLVAQCGCSAGQACQYNGAAGVHCAAAGALPAGTYCRSETECASGLSCIWIYGTTNGVCVAFCDDDGDCGDPAARCIAIPMVDQAGVCSFPCDPLDGTTCPSDVQACDIVLRTTFDGTPATPVTVCRTAGSVPAGGACATSAECVGEAGCRAGICRFFCDVAAPTCPAPTTCTARTPPWRIGDVDYGLCE